jgi:hypothetical protein
MLLVKHKKNYIHGNCMVTYSIAVLKIKERGKNLFRQVLEGAIIN